MSGCVAVATTSLRVTDAAENQTWSSSWSPRSTALVVSSDDDRDNAVSPGLLLKERDLTTEEDAEYEYYDVDPDFDPRDVAVSSDAYTGPNAASEPVAAQVPVSPAADATSLGRDYIKGSGLHKRIR